MTNSVLLLQPPRCEHCGTTEGHIAMRAQNTNYQRPLVEIERRAARALEILTGRYQSPVTYDEVANRNLSLCDECAEENDAFWRDRWEDYYRMCL